MSPCPASLSSSGPAFRVFFKIPFRNEWLIKKEAGGRKWKEKASGVIALLQIITDNGAIVICLVFYFVSVFSLRFMARIILGYLGECRPFRKALHRSHSRAASDEPVQTVAVKF